VPLLVAHLLGCSSGSVSHASTMLGAVPAPLYKARCLLSSLPLPNLDGRHPPGFMS
jgi:hypothetical protein